MRDLDDDEKLNKLKTLHDKAYTANQTTREKMSDDLVFYWVTQWDDNLIGDAGLKYRGEFNLIRKAGRDILSALNANQTSIDFFPKNEEREDNAEFIDGLYRTSNRQNSCLEAKKNALTEAVVCGFGAYVRDTEYVSMRNGDSSQEIIGEPIYEACNTAFPDPNAKLADKSDAMYWSILAPYTRDGLKELVENLGHDDVNPSSFAAPENSFVFPWTGSGNDLVYAVKFFHKEIVKDVVITFADPITGEPAQYLESQLSEVIDELAEAGYTIIDEKEIERYQVTRYTAIADRILDESVIAGELIPVIPIYGERAFVEGEEHVEGITRLAKDPQRLHNFVQSYLVDIVAQGNREKPLFDPRQIQSFEHMYEEAGADNNYPYGLINLVDAQGNPLPSGPVATLPPPSVPPALAAVMETSRRGVEDVANPALPQNIADPDLSGKAVIALQNQIDKQSMIYQENKKHSDRYDASVFVSMATEVYDAPRRVILTNPDGTQKTAMMMETVVDSETGEIVTLNDLSNQEFEVYADIAPSYSSQREQTMEQIDTTLQQVAQGTPLHTLLTFKKMNMMQGVEWGDVKEWTRKQMLLNGFVEPETEEEAAMVQQASQESSAPNLEEMAVQTQMLQAQRGVAAEQNKAVELQLKAQELGLKQQDLQIDAAKTAADIQHNQADTAISAYNAQTQRQKAEVDAQAKGIDASIKMRDSIGRTVERETLDFSRLRGSVG